jgi:hypothetical protein
VEVGSVLTPLAPGEPGYGRGEDDEHVDGRATAPRLTSLTGLGRPTKLRQNLLALSLSLRAGPDAHLRLSPLRSGSTPWTGQSGTGLEEGRGRANLAMVAGYVLATLSSVSSRHSWATALTVNEPAKPARPLTVAATNGPAR